MLYGDGEKFVFPSLSREADGDELALKNITIPCRRWWWEVMLDGDGNKIKIDEKKIVF